MISKDIHGNTYEVSAADLSWRPSAYGIVIYEHKILLMRENGRYHLPGGGIELGEAPEEAVLREVLEEAGVIVTKPRLITLNSTLFTWKELEPPNAVTHMHSLLLYYACGYNGAAASTTALEAEERLLGLEAEWVSLATLDDIIVGTTVDWRPVIKQVV